MQWGRWYLHRYRTRRNHDVVGLVGRLLAIVIRHFDLFSTDHFAGAVDSRYTIGLEQGTDTAHVLGDNGILELQHLADIRLGRLQINADLREVIARFDEFV